MPDETPSSDAARAILTLLHERGINKTICPSEAARLLAPDDWRGAMPAVHAAAAALQKEGEVEATWRSSPVDLARAPGPYRLARSR